jgi:glycosyltransferase involved in cell wall biosynthesis
MTGGPSVSVVIGTYNRGSLIASTLDSVLAQTRVPDEIVVIDDGSTDGTGDWIREHYSGVRTITVPNRGTSATRNRGAEHATSDVLVFLDHDDWIMPHAVETLLALLARFPDARAAYADHELKNVVDGEHFPDHHTAQPAFHRLRQVPVIEQDGDARLYGRPLHYAMLRGNLLQQPWAIYRSDFLAIGGFDPAVRYCEDWELYLRVTNRHPIVLSDRVVSVHLIEGQNLHRAAGQDVQHMKVIRKHIAASGNDAIKRRVLRQRLANYYKTQGDQLRAAGEPGSWHRYTRSLKTWPFDPVVLARWVLWLPSGLGDSRRGYVPPPD